MTQSDYEKLRDAAADAHVRIKTIYGDVNFPYSESRKDFILGSDHTYALLTKELNELSKMNSDGCGLLAKAYEERDALKSKLGVAVSAIEKITEICPHDDGDNGELCGCSTDMNTKLKVLVSKLTAPKEGG